jgi:hypothetical protein
MTGRAGRINNFPTGPSRFPPDLPRDVKVLYSPHYFKEIGNIS